MKYSFYSIEKQEVNNTTYGTMRNNTTLRKDLHKLNLQQMKKQSSRNYDLDTFLSDGLLKDLCKKQTTVKKRLTLNKEEERAIIIEAQQGNTEASALLIQSLLNYLCQVTEYAYRFIGDTVASITKQDLFEEVLKGTLEVLPRFDPTRNCRFVTFLEMQLTYYLQQCLYSWCKNRDNETRYYDSFYNYGKHDEQIEIEHQFIEDKINSSFCGRQEVYDALFQLSDREREVITGIFFQDCKLKELGEELHVSSQRVHQIQQAAEKRLYHLLKPFLCA